MRRIVIIIVLLLSACTTTGDALKGELLFKSGVPGAPTCGSCHTLGTQSFRQLGPDMLGIAERAGSRVEGMSAETYIRDSILHPSNFLVPGFRNSMYADYQDKLTDQDIADLTAYLLSLSAEK